MGDEYTGYLYAAHKDILAIEALSQNIDVHCEVIAFHAQQAAEKIIKNVFEANGIIPAKTHHLDDLLMEAINKKWLAATQEDIRSAIHLSHYAVAARYADMPDIGRGEALSAILDCNRLSKLVESAGYPAPRINIEAEFLNPDKAENSLEQVNRDCTAASHDSGLNKTPDGRDERGDRT